MPFVAETLKRDIATALELDETTSVVTATNYAEAPAYTTTNIYYLDDMQMVELAEHPKSKMPVLCERIWHDAEPGDVMAITALNNGRTLYALKLPFTWSLLRDLVVGYLTE